MHRSDWLSQTEAGKSLRKFCSLTLRIGLVKEFTLPTEVVNNFIDKMQHHSHMVIIMNALRPKFYPHWHTSA